MLRRYHTAADASAGSSIMNLIKNKIGSHSKGQLTISSRQDDKSKRELFGGGKENRSLFANLPIKATTREDKPSTQHGPSSDSLLTLPNKPPSIDKTRPANGNRSESQQLMMSRIGWLFELRNLLDKLKRKTNGSSVSKEHFLGQFKRVVGVAIG